MRLPGIVLPGLALLLAACASPPQGAVPLPDPAALAEKADRAELLVAERFQAQEGFLVYRRPADAGPCRPPYGDLADTACWTGWLLGAEALRHALEGAPASRAALDRALAGLEALHAATGIPGLLPRTLDRDVPREDLARRGGEWRPGTAPGTVYRADVSRDQYAGAVFGLGCVLRLVRDPDFRRRAGALAVAIAARLRDGGFAIRGPDGEVTPDGELPVRVLGFPVSANATLLLAVCRLAAVAEPEGEWPALYADLVDRGLPRAASFAEVRVLGYAKLSNQLMSAGGLFHLHALEEDPAAREQYRRGLARIAAGAEGEENALFEALAMAAEGPRPDRLAALLDVLARTPIEKVTGPVDLRDEGSGVVPVEDRVATAFLWRSDPRLRVRDPEGRKPPVAYAPVDFLVACRLARALSATSPSPRRPPERPRLPPPPGSSPTPRARP